MENVAVNKFSLTENNSSKKMSLRDVNTVWHCRLWFD